MSVFVSAGLISAPGTPCTLKEVKRVVVWDPHTHTHTLTNHYSHLRLLLQIPVAAISVVSVVSVLS